MFQRSIWTGIVVPCFIAMLLVCTGLQAQNVTGTLTGTVADPSGAVIPGATVIMKNEQSGDERRTVSNTDGFFSINAVQPVTIRSSSVRRALRSTKRPACISTRVTNATFRTSL